MKIILQKYFRRKSAVRNTILFCASITVLQACNKTDYLDVEAANRPPLTAKVSYVNARPVNQPINFYMYTSQVTPTPVLMNKATPYMDAQFGLIQINIAASGSTSYLASRVFGGSAEFNTTGGPNGPIAGYYHTVFAMKAKASNFSVDSLMLFYDDLNAPAAGRAKLRFVHLSPGAAPVDVSFNGSSVFSNVNYGAAGDAVLSGAGLNAYSIGPFKSIPSGAGALVVRTSATGNVLKFNSTELDNLNLQAGKIYTVFITGDANATVTGTVLQHN